MAKSKEKRGKNAEYIYIVQAALETNKCKIGKTKDLEKRLKDYNNMTGKSKDNEYQYLFACEVKNMTQVEKDLKEKYFSLREEKSKEIYFYNAELYKHYVIFIKTHTLFVKEIVVKTEPKKQVTKIIKKTTPTLEDRGITRRDVFQKAQKAKDDEFYTRLEDVEKELSMYNKSIWKNKTVFCNCDDAVDDDERRTSAFSLYFLQNFNELGLKKLICTHYSGPIDLYKGTGNVTCPFAKKAYVAYIYTVTDGGLKREIIYPENYTGSLDDPLSLKILKEEADIVCTNPPFSRANDYWETLIKSGKKFIIISNFTNTVTKTFIPYFKDKKIWPGYNRVDYFLNPKKQIVMASGHWYTNVPIKNRPKYKNMKFVPLKEIPEKYRKHDDKKILMVDNNYIPNDYKKPFAVSAYPILSGVLEKGYDLIQDKEYYPYINGKKCFARVLV